MTQALIAFRGDLRRIMAQERRTAETAVTSVVKSKTRSITKAVQREVRRGGFERGQSGQPLDQTVKGTVYPRRGRSIEAAGRVASKAVYRRPGGDVDLLTVFKEGATVRAGGGRFLAIPTNAAPFREGRGGTRAATPAQYTGPTAVFRVRRDLLAVYDPTRRPDPQGRPVVLWWLVPQVTLAPRIDPDRAYRRLIANIDDLIARRWEREATKRGQI